MNAEEYPFYSETYLTEKARVHEDRYPDPPEDPESPEFDAYVMRELRLIATEDMIGYLVEADLTDEQMFVLRHWLNGKDLETISELKLAENGQKVTQQAVRKTLRLGGRKVIELSSKSPFFGWFLVYLEDVLRKKLF